MKNGVQQMRNVATTMLSVLTARCSLSRPFARRLCCCEAIVVERRNGNELAGVIGTTRCEGVAPFENDIRRASRAAAEARITEPELLIGTTEQREVLSLLPRRAVRNCASATTSTSAHLMSRLDFDIDGEWSLSLEKTRFPFWSEGLWQVNGYRWPLARLPTERVSCTLILERSSWSTLCTLREYGGTARITGEYVLQSSFLSDMAAIDEDKRTIFECKTSLECISPETHGLFESRSCGGLALNLEPECESELQRPAEAVTIASSVVLAGRLGLWMVDRLMSA